MLKRNIICHEIDQGWEVLLPEVDNNPLLAKILYQRGLTKPEEVRIFLEPNQYRPSSPWDFPGLVEGTELILAALNKGEHFCVYGDYDVDGITSATLLVSLLRSLEAKVTYHVPDRFKEGYGMNGEVIRQLAADGVTFLVTCDCGISNGEEVALAKELGLTVVVTDHHLLPETLPSAQAIINPQLLPEGHPAGHLPGVGVAYFLARALLAKLGREKEADGFLDLVALGVVGDVVSLRQENRYLLQRGLPMLADTTRPGLQALLEVSGVVRDYLSEEDLGFQLVPRLNAAGRIASARLGVELLLAQDQLTAQKLAKNIDGINKRRKEIGEKMQEEALAMVGKEAVGRPLVLYQPHWHHGVIGIIAGRLCEKYGVPVALMSLQEDGQTITGSARSIDGIHILQALQKCAQFLRKFGGHAGAAGFSLHRDNLTAFTLSLEQVLAEEIQQQGGVQQVVADANLSLEEAGLDLLHDLHKLAPFGEANPTPQFYCGGVEVLNQRPTTGDKHLQLVVRHQGASHRAVWWWGGGQHLPAKVDLVYTLGLNRWQGRENLQLVISHLEPAQVPSPILPEAQSLKKLILEDRRAWVELGQQLPSYPGAVYFYEAISPLKGFAGQDRNQMASGEVLVLLACPPHLRLLQELFMLSGAERVVLAYGQNNQTMGEDFLKDLTGLVKYVVTQEGGRVGLSQLAALTGEMENTVAAALMYLQARGFLEHQYLNPGEVLLAKGTGELQGDVKRIEAKLKELLGESRAFRKYMREAPISSLEKYLNK